MKLRIAIKGTVRALTDRTWYTEKFGLQIPSHGEFIKVKIDDDSCRGTIEIPCPHKSTFQGQRVELTLNLNLVEAGDDVSALKAQGLSVCDDQSGNKRPLNERFSEAVRGGL